jgi:uncharacterized protein
MSSTTAHEFTISVSDLDAGGRDYRFAVRPGWIRGVLEDHEATAANHEGTLAVRASKSAQQVVVHGTLDATVAIPCARCLEPYEQPVHSDVSVLYVPRSQLKAEASHGDEDLALTDEEADTFPFDGETVVLDDLVRDELVLELPMIPLCSEACPGMSPAPDVGAASPPEEKTLDPRLAPLLSFRAKSTKKA